MEKGALLVAPSLRGELPRAHNANRISIMARDADDQPLLGEVEQLVLLAVLRLGDEAYAVPIQELIGAEAGIELSRGTIYVTLERLERKGYVTSWFSDPQAVRGGKARRVFQVKPAGVQASRAAKRAVDQLSAGTVLARPAKA
jgi:DNA-binding PadR family transcriptional regulator